MHSHQSLINALAPASLCAAYAEEIAEHEIAHVKFLQTALGNDTIECPALDIGAAFSAAANAAVNASAELSPPYSPYYDDKWFLLGAFIFEGESTTFLSLSLLMRMCVLYVHLIYYYCCCC
jgi:Ferritin-like domain